MIRFNPQRLLIYLYVALGPLGTLLTPAFLPKSFRSYYFVLPLFPLFFRIVNERIAKIGILFLPLLTYAFFSSAWTECLGKANEPHSLFRYGLLISQFFFVLGAASVIKNQKELVSFLKTYLVFFYVSLLVGYFFFFGYYLKIISLAQIARCSILVQFGWGLLRFSPGSYPNEYGIVSSFVLSFMLLIYFAQKEAQFGLSKKMLYILFSLTFLAFLLTTTRAAYLSFATSLLYIAIKEKKRLKRLLRFFLLITAIFGALSYFEINMFTILRTGFSQKIHQGSFGERYFMWQTALERLQGHEFLGVGFTSLTNIHDVYIQLLLELGFIGSLLLFGGLFLSAIETFFSLKKMNPLEEEHRFFTKVRVVGLINVLSFAFTNHNLNHHMTWFIVLLNLAALREAHAALELAKK
ncbi:MAG: hypothetical protein A3D96_03270 [Chlamydiae bacterium RIFCSPHIGHO2_12_FULL_44_59]|nr:MAG: hypothetical protein A2796_00335 [Chlamydiae bacterium RIFCSPHIGHO2_01_FULL_44_39]OGN56718.1 MAG: hypothetical protein A3C42_06105 [Chlamydiae bacterium RIFCSPHIGHO2_02_FULL_45_9]OGN60590.1 MAG: hypothetical protein A3D96_03270 [Chlamydiae bacterium RIFCSPHIGHO2_12_FULL_44_59]OGN66406.1 MAG: hypothetical protein A2978_03785 [Chlamydiae bacterium RIFCSPLOWO2_01_FULL_44_52]OGN69457.1 MAG: hypothetical protein A3I67_04280 [Chlamydiae bacterium RIFCSPLOWO2_02_FULL_45_22]OGN70713.1 MAG: hyp